MLSNPPSDVGVDSHSAMRSRDRKNFLLSGIELHKRLNLVEINWPYFLGFGLPLAVITSMPESQVMAGCVFSVLFPLFIVSGDYIQLRKS